jgi:RNA recognition motif-containing protein
MAFNTEYDDLIKEFKNFGQVSGSRINEQKTEILKIGNTDTLNHPHIHQLVKRQGKSVRNMVW